MTESEKIARDKALQNVVWELRKLCGRSLGATQVQEGHLRMRSLARFDSEAGIVLIVSEYERESRAKPWFLIAYEVFGALPGFTHDETRASLAAYIAGGKKD